MGRGWGRASTLGLLASRVLGVREMGPLCRGMEEEGPLRRDVCGLLMLLGALEQWARQPSLLALAEGEQEGLVMVRRQEGWV